MNVIVERVRREVRRGAVVPKPASTRDYVVKGWGRRRGEDALIYRIPNRRNPGHSYEKGITESEFEEAYRHLRKDGAISRKWFDRNMQACAKEGSCNFTTIGGIFELLGIAIYERGSYVATARIRIRMALP